MKRLPLAPSVLVIRWLPALVLGLALSLTVLASLLVRQRIDAYAAREFAVTCDQATLKIEERLAAYALILRGAAGLFAASGMVDRQEWRAYIDTLHASRNISGVQGIGFAQLIAPHQLAAHVARVRRQGFPEYTVRPAGERAIITSIIYLEPFRDRNLRAFGFDMFFEPVRRAAMEQARDSGEAALSGKVELVQESDRDVQAGSLMYVPVYRRGATPETVAERRAALIGWTYSPYRMKDLVTGILADWTRDAGGQVVDLHIHAGRAPSPATLLFDSELGETPDTASLFYQQRTIDFNGTPWLLIFAASGAAPGSSYLPAWATLIGGLALSGLLFGLMLSVNHTRTGANHIAEELTAELRRRAALLQESEARFRSYFNLPLIGIAVTSVEKAWLEVNPRLCQILGYAREELVRLTWAEMTHPDDVAADMAEFERVLRGESDGYSLDKRFIRKDGRVIDAALAVRCMRCDDGRSDYFVAVVQDITAQKRFEAELIDAREQAQQASLAKSRFLATMSHEIRTPMNAIFGMAQLLMMPGLEQDERLDYARTILHSGQALLSLLNDILDLSKVEAGKVKLALAVIDPGQILAQALSLFSGAAGAKFLRFAADAGSPAGQRYLGDPSRLRQMLANLVGNAIKFTAQGEVRLEAFEVERDATTAVLEFAVSDTGIGIAEGQRRLLFQPFSQADSSTTRQYGGSGLGLSIVRTLARLMGGDAGVDSEAGRGSRFWFRIRAPLVVAGEESRVAELPHEAWSEAGALAGRVLVVEDNPTNAKVIGALLAKLGLTSVLVEDGALAVEAIIRGDPVDLVLMDLQLPVLDGYAATERIRRWEAAAGRQRLPIIALTADAFEDDRRRCLNADMDDFLAKPVVVASLKRVLARWLAPSETSGMSEPLPPAAASPDMPRVLALVDEIMPLLAQNRFDAIIRFRDLAALLAGTRLAPRIDEVGRLLEAFRFDLAREHLQRMAVGEGRENVN